MILLTPGPVQTHPTVRAAMNQDVAPWNAGFRPVYEEVRHRLRALAGGIDGAHVTLPLQGAGHMLMEAAIRSFVASGAAILIPMNGEYARRMARLAREAGRVVIELPLPDTRGARAEEVAEALSRHPEATHVAMVQSETGSGIVNDPAAIGAAVRAAGRRMILDAVSAFGALPLDLAAQPEVDAACFTSNKCLEGVPGFGFAVARVDRLEAGAGQAGSWSLDLSDVWKNTQVNGWGSMRFTGPVQAILAMRVALDRLDAEGGREVRLARYRANARALHEGFAALGLRPYLSAKDQGPIVVTVHQPEGLDFPRFIAAMERNGVTVSAYFTTDAPSFRVGAIGDVGLPEMRRAVEAVRDSLAELGLPRAA
ncbi:2-aminoethylphosphonate--pyruvate transaminase [Sabulicella rubraurantiaca]|uniref:2-aminoethylphosphonate--pyruvate transaminase n=1 Tax=Sabulicella rubraurantiaca TaxID=2811429 RepID=UPI001A96FF3A|nr:2-aminoethylphosphonate--pyruvate transaminase [Sabulicella rubraurantiaca]